MAEIRLQTMALEAGRLIAHLSGLDGPTALSLRCEGETIAEANTTPDAGATAWVGFEVPAEALRDGATLFELRGPTGGLLGQHLFMAGPAVSGDAQAEIAVLRGELQALKRAFLAEASDPKLRVADRALIIAEAVEAALGSADR